MPTCNKENMKKWVAALRSGEYQQTKGMLTHISPEGKETHCCLGVACAISGVAERRVVDDLFCGDHFVRWSGHESNLPAAVVGWLGLDWGNPTIAILDSDTPVVAAYANDVKGWTFEQIADAIESYYELNAPETSYAPALPTA